MLPTAAWWRRLSDVADAKAVDFGLRDDKQGLPFVFLQTSDDHSSAHSNNLFRRKADGGIYSGCSRPRQRKLPALDRNGRCRRVIQSG